VKSSAEEQRNLIELQDLDLQLARLDHQTKTLPVLKELAQATEAFESHDALAIASATEKSDIEVELRRSESDVEQVSARISKDQQFVDSGQASAKDLQNLLGELQSLNRRKQELEEVELEIMVRIDRYQAKRNLPRSRSKGSDHLEGIAGALSQDQGFEWRSRCGAPQGRSMRGLPLGHQCSGVDSDQVSC